MSVLDLAGRNRRTGFAATEERPNLCLLVTRGHTRMASHQPLPREYKILRRMVERAPLGENRRGQEPIPTPARNSHTEDLSLEEERSLYLGGNVGSMRSCPARAVISSTMAPNGTASR